MIVGGSILIASIASRAALGPRWSPQIARYNYKKIIGKREIVGFGWNGQPGYADMTDFPFPSIRWKEPSCEIEELRKKEKCDWREMSVCEKRELYRASFCQTYAEFTAPSGEWKSVIGYGCMLIAVGCWVFYFLRYMVWPGLPDSFRDECREAQFRRMLDIRANPIYGVSSKWDYDKDDWK